VDALTLERWQFGITTVYHFIFVPLTIGLAPLIALLQTFWVKTGKEEWYRLTRFFGKLFLINFALGIVTGIVQEFQFGMTFSEYARYVGDIFGAPLAMEALSAFFIESTFLGVWIFGWGRLNRGVHLASIWLVAFATNLSAYYILAANSFMQYPKGAVINPVTGRAEMTSLKDMLFSELSLSTFWHTISTAFVVAGTFMAGIAIWWVVRATRAQDESRAQVYRKGATVGLVALVLAGVSLIFSGHNQAVVMTRLQPAKMAAAEGLCVTPPAGEGAPFTVAALGDCKPGQGDESMSRMVQIPGLFSFMAKLDAKAPIPGTDKIRAEFAEAFPQLEADVIPPVMPTFWSFRLMMGFGVFSAALALWGLIALRGGRLSSSKALGRFAVIALPMPFIAAAFGWIFTEIGRQPWIVTPIYAELGTSPNLLVSQGNSPADVVTSTQVWITMVGLTLIYLILAVFWFLLQRRYTARGITDDDPIPTPDDDADLTKPLTFAY